jgi:hypothetical protein
MKVSHPNLTVWTVDGPITLAWHVEGQKGDYSRVVEPDEVFEGKRAGDYAVGVHPLKEMPPVKQN